LPYEWQKSPGEIARLVTASEFGGLFRKEILVRENERAVFLLDGRIVKVFDAGMHEVGGWLSGLKGKVEALFVDYSDVDLDWRVGELWTGDGYRIGGYGKLRLRLASPEKLYANYRLTRTIGRSLCLTAEDLSARLGLELQNNISPVIKARKIDELYGNPEVREGCYNGIDFEMRKTLDRWGIELVQFSVDYSFPQDWVAWKEQTARRGRVVEEIKIQKEESRERVLGEQELQRIQVESELERDRLEFQQALEMKRQLEEQKRQKEEAEMRLRQTEREAEFRREKEREEAEREATMKVMEEAIKAGTASPEVVRAYLEQQTLRKVVEKGAAAEVARAIQERASLEVHKESEEREYERARGLIEAQRQPVARVQASCPSCGKRLPEGARFCPECGATV
jgi:hypothetical protein